MTLLADAYNAILISVYKPIVFMIFMGLWAWIATQIDRESKRAKLKRGTWNSILIATGALGAFVWLIIPIFWVGIFVALLIMAGGIGAYVMYHNKNIADPSEAWTFSLAEWKERVAEKKIVEQARDAKVVLTASNGQAMDVPKGDDPFVNAHYRFEEIMEFAVPRGSSRVDMAVNAQKARMVAHIDGVRYRLPDTDAAVAVSLIDYLKTFARLDVEDRRKKQVGNLHFKSINTGAHSLGVTTWGSTRELVLQMNIDQEKGGLLKLEEMGLLAAQLDQLKPILEDQTRVVIVSCPPGQGQTTTLYNLMQTHDPYINNVQTMEKQPEYELEGITHTEMDPKEFKPRLTTLLRSEPQVIMLSEIEDGQLAQILAQSCDEVRYYVGMRYGDTFTALKGWVKAVGDPGDASESLAAIVSQRLVRKLCTTCRVPFQPDADALRKLNLSDRVTQLFRNSGQVMGKKGPEVCPTCQGLGYRGRFGVYEVMALDEDARKILAQGQLDHLRSHLRKQRMLWLQEAALAKVVEGVTSIQEITRALGKDADKVVALPTFTPPDQAKK